MGEGAKEVKTPEEKSETKSKPVVQQPEQGRDRGTNSHPEKGKIPAVTKVPLRWK